MTSDEFLAFYPQFAAGFPEIVMEAVTASANARFGDFEEDAEEARRLYMAHRLTLYAKTVPASSASGEIAPASFSSLAGAGDGTRIVSRKVDDVAVTYASSVGESSESSALADLKETVYGRQLLALLRLHAWPEYVP